MSIKIAVVEGDGIDNIDGIDGIDGV